MAWLRVGDTFATDPRILALVDPADPLMGPACKGFFLELAALSANSSTDYVITRGHMNLAGGTAAPALLRRCERAGLIRPLDGRGASRRWKLIDDAPELIHIRLKDEVAWEKQQKADTNNVEYRAAVYLRDGDACRWCGRVVQPNDNKSYRGKTIDHLRSGQKARGPQDLVVACRGCNGRRGKEWLDASDDDARAEFEQRWQLRPPPSPLIFIRSTVTWLADRGHAVPTGSTISEAAPPARETASSTSGPEEPHPAAAGVAAPARSTTAPEAQHPTSQVGVADPGAGTSSATHPAPPGVAAPPPADQHPATQAGVAAPTDSAPERQHPATAGVAASESRTDRPPTDRSGTAGPGRAGSGRAGPGGFLPSLVPPAHPPSPPGPAPGTAAPRRTRRGRRRSRSGGTDAQHP